jgi:poly-gamma-glutamate synthesis protein (capsule biosynthesis protein)
VNNFQNIPDLTLVGDWAIHDDNQIKFNHKFKYLLLNFEGPVVYKNYKKIKKAGPIIKNIKFPQINNSILNLANNHFMDYGITNAKKNIIEIKKKNKYVGFGNNLKDSRKEVVLNLKKKVAIIGCAEPQFGMSKPNKAGVCEVGPWIIDKIHQLKKKCKIIIISIHGSLETSPFPIPDTQDLYKSWIDAGASIIHGHHSHIPQGYEKYKDGYIFYGLGNFCVDPDKWTDHKNNRWSLSVDIFLKKKLKIKINYFEIKKKNREITISKNNRKKYTNYFKTINSVIKDRIKLINIWDEFSLQIFENYGKKYVDWDKKSIKTRLKNLFKELLNLNKDLSDHRLLMYYHMMSLESHRLMLKNATSILCGEKIYKPNYKIKKLIRKFCYF